MKEILKKIDDAADIDQKTANRIVRLITKAVRIIGIVGLIEIIIALTFANVLSGTASTDMLLSGIACTLIYIIAALIKCEINSKGGAEND